MRKLTFALILAVPCMLAPHSISADNVKDYFKYVSPLPNSQLVTKETTIILRPSDGTQLRNVDSQHALKVVGSISGAHKGDLIVSDDGETVIFKPYDCFEAGEKVTVFVDILSQKKGTPKHKVLPFDFTISRKRVELDRNLEYELLLDEDEHFQDAPSSVRSGHTYRKALAHSAPNDFELPPDFPQITVTDIDNPGSGYIFTSNLREFPGQPPPYLMILDNTGFPVFFRKLSGNGLDFKKQPNGLLTYYQYGAGFRYYALDNSYTVVDSFSARNGYPTDMHDLQILPNNHVLIIGNDAQIFDMSKVIAGGDTAAVVLGQVIQELDESDNVVFQWRTWDHYNILDSYFPLTGHFVLYSHINAVEGDFDGNILVSSRHMNEITKINRQTGDVIWRLGGKNNDFTLVNDTIWFSFQHSVRRLQNGDITIFDNGNLNSPRESRAVEYQLDEDNKIATLVWQYRNTPASYGSRMGSVQRLPGGNTMVCWGSDNPNVTEVHPDGSKAFEMSFNNRVYAYRSFRSEWNGIAAAPYLWADSTNQELTLYFTKFGDTDVLKYYIYKGTSPHPTTRVDSTAGNSWRVRNFIAGETLYFRVTAVSGSMQESPYSNELEITPGFADISVITVGIRIAPRTLNLKSKGRWITAWIELPDTCGYSLADIDLSSILLNDNVHADLHSNSVGDDDGDLVPEMKAKFPRDEVENILPAGEEVEVRVRGKVGESFFEGADTIRVIHPDVAEDQKEKKGGKSSRLSLSQNFPNPFNPSTTIEFTLPSQAQADLAVYSVDGELVRRLVNRELPEGSHRITWDGKDGVGNAVSSGVYLYRLRAGSRVITKKMILIK